MTPSQERLIQELTEVSPNLGEIRESSISDYGELLPHLFFGDLTRYVVALFLETQSDDGSGSERAKVLRSLLEVLERAFAEGDEKIQELISVSFLEHLPRPREEPGWQIRSLIGPQMSEQLEVIG